MSRHLQPHGMLTLYTRLTGSKDTQKVIGGSEYYAVSDNGICKRTQ